MQCWYAELGNLSKKPLYIKENFLEEMMFEYRIRLSGECEGEEAEKSFWDRGRAWEKAMVRVNMT